MDTPDLLAENNAADQRYGNRESSQACHGEVSKSCLACSSRYRHKIAQHVQSGCGAFEIDHTILSNLPAEMIDAQRHAGHIGSQQHSNTGLCHGLAHHNVVTRSPHDYGGEERGRIAVIGTNCLLS